MVADAAARGGPQRIPRPTDAAAGAPAPWAELPDDRRHPSVDQVRRALEGLGPPVPSPVEREGFAAMWRGRPVPAPGGFPEARASAVLVPLYDHDGEAWVVLTRRSANLRAHSGEVSFPGGRHDDGDPDLVATALREANEEIALDPTHVEVVGELDHLATVTSGSFIVPYVGVLEGRPQALRPHEAEVEAVIHVALSELLADGVFREELWSWGDVVRPIVFFDLLGDTVWGATASMLRQLLGVVTGTLGRGDLGHD